MTDIHEMNGLKSLLGVALNGVALVAFIVDGAIALDAGPRDGGRRRSPAGTPERRWPGRSTAGTSASLVIVDRVGDDDLLLLPTSVSARIGPESAFADASCANARYNRMDAERWRVDGRRVRPREACRARSARARCPARARCWSRCAPAASAAPICTSSTASCRESAVCRSSPATRSSASSRRSATASTTLTLGDRVGVPWLGYTCGVCEYCRQRAREPVPRRARSPATRLDGGYAEYAVADARYAFKLPDQLRRRSKRRRCCAPASSAIAPTAWPATPRRLGIYGFGAAAHIVAQVAVHEGREVYAFTSPGDDDGAGVRAVSSGCGLGGRVDASAAGAARRRDHLRAGRRARAGGARARGAAAARWSAPAST